MNDDRDAHKSVLSLYVKQFIIPEGGIDAGAIFSYGDGPFSELWEEPEGLFDLSINGDNIFLYCIDADDLPHFITGFSYAGDWFDVDDIDPADPPIDRSALPEDLFEFGSVALPHFDNNLYIGNLTAFKSELLAAFMEPGNYEGSDDLRFGLVDPETSASWMQYHGTQSVVAALAMVPLVFIYLS
jgi:hypothetical protein